MLILGTPQTARTAAAAIIRRGLAGAAEKHRRGEPVFIIDVCGITTRQP
jgi:hypothetical protein